MLLHQASVQDGWATSGGGSGGGSIGAWAHASLNHDDTAVAKWCRCVCPAPASLQELAAQLHHLQQQAAASQAVHEAQAMQLQSTIDQLRREQSAAEAAAPAGSGSAPHSRKASIDGLAAEAWPGAGSSQTAAHAAAAAATAADPQVLRALQQEVALLQRQLADAAAAPRQSYDRTWERFELDRLRNLVSERDREVAELGSQLEVLAAASSSGDVGGDRAAAPASSHMAGGGGGGPAPVVEALRRKLAQSEAALRDMQERLAVLQVGPGQAGSQTGGR